MKISSLLKENEQLLRALASLVVILGFGGALVKAIIPAIRSPELILTVEMDRSTLPPDLIVYARQCSRTFDRLRYYAGEAAAPTSDNTTNKTQSPKPTLQEIKFSLLLGRLNEELSRIAEYSKTAQRVADASAAIDELHLALRNESDHNISGVRLTVDSSLSFWDAAAEGTYITEAEREGISKSASFSKEAHRLVLSNIPPLPGRSYIKLNVFGSFVPRYPNDNPDITISAPGAAVKIEEIVRASNDGLVWFSRSQYKSSVYIFLLGTLAMFSLFWLIDRFSRARNRSTPPQGDMPQHSEDSGGS